MIVELRFEAGRSRQWMHRLVRHLGEDHAVHVRWLAAGEAPPAGLDALLTLEKMLLRRGGANGADRADPVQAHDPDNPDIIVDFTAAPFEGTGRHLRVLFDGAAGENAALAAILAGDLPLIEIQDGSDGAIVGRAKPSAELAHGLGGALDSVMARALTLVSATLDPRRPQTREPVRDFVQPVLDRGPTGFVLRSLTESVARAIYRLVCYAPHWRIGWRDIGQDGGVWSRGDLSGAPWQVIPCPADRFYADPFPVTSRGRTALLFEDLDHRTGRGRISALAFGPDGPRGEVVSAIEEPWHLSYPFVIEHGGALWMIPESTEARDVALYRCVEFPHRWERHATLLDDLVLADATVVQHEGLFYLFGASRDGGGGFSDTLAIYWSESLFGPWRPHGRNPVLIDRAAARPAGHFVRQGGRLRRPVQDCTNGYGAALALADIDELTPTTFRQTITHVIAPGPLWPGRKLHTLNRSGSLEFIDGTSIQPKWSALRRGADKTGITQAKPATAAGAEEAASRMRSPADLQRS